MSKSKTKLLLDSSPIQRLVTAIGQAAISAKFFVAGSLPAVDPGLVVVGMGSVRVPLKRGAAGSFERTLKRYEDDLKLLSALPSVS